MEFLIKKGTPCEPFHKHWEFCVGSGHAKLALRSDYRKMLKQVHDDLGIQHVRFHGIFNDDMTTETNLTDLFPIPGVDSFRERSFRQCGAVYDNVLSTGMKPFVELGFMPKALASGDSQIAFYYKGNNTMPKDDTIWAEYIQDFIRYLQHRYTPEEVRTWFFEVWNEPDLGFFSGSQEDYFHLYEITARAIKKVDPEIRVGGPATSASKWVAPFVRFCREHDVPVDFISTHQYAGGPIGGLEEDTSSIEDELDHPKQQPDMKETFGKMIPLIMQRFTQAPDHSLLTGWRCLMEDRSETADIVDYTFRVHSNIVKKQAQDLPVYYTEWNENAIFGAVTNDTRKVAAYLVRACLETENNMEGSSIWCFSDLFEEFHHFPQEFHGGFGLLTQSGIPKPGYYAMRMLHDAGNLRLNLGENATMEEVGIAAFQKGNELQVLLFRQKMKNAPLPAEHVTVKIELPNQPSAVTVEKIDEHHGNPYDLWKAQGAPQDLNAQEVQNLIDASAVKQEKMLFTYENGVLSCEADMMVNDVYFIHVNKSTPA